MVPVRVIVKHEDPLVLRGFAPINRGQLLFRLCRLL